MASMARAASIVLPLFLVMGLGYALRRRGWASAREADALNRFMFYVALPALLLASLLTQPVDLGAALRPVAVYAFGLAAATLAAALLFGGFAPPLRGALVVGAFRGNLAYIGLPVIAAAQGTSALGPAAVVIGAATFAVTVMSVIFLERLRARPGGPGPREQLRAVALNPQVLACVLGVALRAADVRLPGVLLDALSMLGQAALPAALLALGAAMTRPVPRGHLGLALAASAVKIVLMPLAGWALAAVWPGLPPADLTLAVLLLACPTAIISFSVIVELGGDARVAAATITLSTLLSLLTLTGWVALLAEP